MPDRIDRRAFLRTGTAAGAAAALPIGVGTLAAGRAEAPVIHTPQSVPPVVISDLSGINFTNGGPRSCVEEAFSRITAGEDVLDALIAGVNIPELDPTETGIGYGGLPNEEGIVQLDACCMHGPRKKAGGVAALEGVRTPSLVAKAVMEYTDHHLLVGAGAQRFARNIGFEIEDDLNTPRSRELWLEWKRRLDPSHYPPPPPPPSRPGEATPIRSGHAGYLAGLSMIRDGLIPAESFWGTVNCDGISPRGEICGVTTTSGLSWKIPGRAGDSPILGAGLYVDGEVGAAGSTGRGEANLYNLSCFLIVEKLREGMHPTDAGMEALRRIRANTIEERLLNSRGEPAFDVRFFVLDRRGRYAGVALYGSAESEYAVCTENGAERRPLESLLSGSPMD